MFNRDEVLRMLKLAIGRLERAPVDLADVAVVQAARADLRQELLGDQLVHLAALDRLVGHAFSFSDAVV